MGINGIGNPFNQPGVYGTEGVGPSKTLERVAREDRQQGDMTVTEARARVSFAVATPQLADAMNLTPDERQAYLQSVEEKAASASLNLGDKSVMLDIYAVMELIREMGQKLRNTMRAMRQDLNQAIQKNLKKQAEMQRDAAKFQMIGGAVVGGLQTGLSLYGTAKQIGSLNAQSEVGKKLGADVVSDQLEMAKAGGREDLSLNQLNKIKKDAPPGVDPNKSLLKSSEVRDKAQLALDDISRLKEDVGELEAAKGTLEDEVAKGTLSEADLKSHTDTISKLSDNSETKCNELDQAVKAYNELLGGDSAQTDKFKDTIAADRKELADAIESRDEVVSRHEQEREDLAFSEGLFGDENASKELTERQATELSAAQDKVKVAREKLVNDYKNESVVATPETAEGQARMHKAMLSEVGEYKKKFESALDRFNNEKRINGKPSAEAKVALDEAKYHYKLARAEQVYQSSRLDKLPPDAHQEVVNDLTNELVDINHRVDGDVKASGAEKSAAYGSLWQGLANSIGGIGQKAVEGWGQIKQSHITEKQADEKMLEEQLDQVKDMFAQDQALIQKATELFQSVVSKESQSLEEIINALKA